MPSSLSSVRRLFLSASFVSVSQLSTFGLVHAACSGLSAES